MLDAGIFDAVNDQTITLRSGKVLGPNCSKNPICIVANYLFDTLYHDIFQVEGGVLKEGLVSTGSKRKVEPDPLEPDIIKRLSNLYQYNPITADSYYTQEDGDELHLGRILQWYQDCFGDNTNGASIVFPIGALRALRRLSSFSNGRMIVISGDKGNNNPEQFVGLMDPHIAVHGSFSLMVNYHAIGMWFTSRGGFALHNPQEEASLKVGCFVLNGASEEKVLSDTEWLRATNPRLSTPDVHPPPLADILPGPPAPAKGLGPALTVQLQAKGYKGSPSTVSADMMNLLTDKDNERSSAFPHLRSSFNDAVDTFGPNDFFVLQKSLKEDAPNPPLKSIVSLLKLGDWDPDVFFKFRDAVLNQIPNCGLKLRNDLCRGIPRVWENYYMLDLDKDIAFEIGRFFYGIRDYTNALNYYIESTNTVGEHHVTYHNQGLCYYSRGELETALKHFEKSLAMNKDYEKAFSWVEKVRKELNKGGEEATEGGGSEEATGALSHSSSVSTIDISQSPASDVGAAAALVSDLSISSGREE
jgi:tetratricopeptide (TPR) repeat protein